MDPEEPQGEPPLNADERKALREIMKREGHAVWLWANIRVVATWVTAVLLAVTVGYDTLKRLVKMLVGP